MDSQFEKAFWAKLEGLAAGLSTDPGGLRALGVPTQKRALGLLIECACLAQNEEAIRLGTSYLRRSPRSLVVGHIKAEMSNPEYLEDEYAYRRLLALCEGLDPAWVPHANARHDLLRRAIAAGLASGDADVREVAERHSARLSGERIPTGTVESPGLFDAMVLEQSEALRLVA